MGGTFMNIFSLKINKVLLLLFLFAFKEAHSSLDIPAAKKESEEKINIFEMKRSMQRQKNKMLELTKEVNNLDVRLGLTNKKYFELAQERALLEEKLNRTKKNADFENETLKKNYDSTKKILMGILLNKLENTENTSDMLLRKIMIEELQNKLTDLSRMITTTENYRNDVENLYAKLQESMATEKELLAMMSELDGQRKKLHESIAERTKAEEELKNKFNEEKNKLAINQKVKAREKLRERLAPVQITEEIKVPSQLSVSEMFSSPITNYHEIEHQKKGVTYNFQGKNAIRATKGGKIVYTGSLANYGNVLMIDHGNDTRTVLLGQFDYTVKNGDLVSQTQVLGHTAPKSPNGLNEGKIYFEIRKHNLAQNTYLLLDKKSMRNEL